MEPAVGSVFAIWVEKWGRYGLKQLCGESDDGWRWWLDLDWFEPELPTDLDALEPLRAFRRYHTGHEPYWLSDNLIPASWVLVGVREPLRTDRPAGRAERLARPMPRTPEAASEYEWMRHPEAQRDAFKRAAASDDTVEVAGEAVPLNTFWKLSPAVMRAPAAELAQLVCVSEVRIDHDRADWAEVLAGFPFLEVVVIDVPLAEITLSSTVTQVTMLPGASADMVVHGGSVTRLLTEDNLFVDLPDLTDLVIHRVKELDVADLAERYPRLVSLRVHGENGLLSNVDALAELTDLEELVLWGMYGFETLPYLPSLTRLDADGIPKSAGVQARKDYEEINLFVTKLRSDAWLADNLGNPFAIWDASDSVPARHAKSAWTAFKRHRKALRDAATQAAAGEMTAEAFGELVSDTITTAAEEFNGWDKSGWIGTVEREEIVEVYFALLKEVSDTYPVDVDAALNTLDQTRDW